MKILYLATWFPHPLDNGSKLRVFHLLRGLAQRHEVTLLSFAFDTADVAGAQALRALCKEVYTVPANPFQRTAWEQRLRFLSLSPVVTRPVPEMTAATQQLLESGGFDLVIASTEVTAVYALLAPAGAVKVLEEHNAMGRWARERLEAQSTRAGRLRSQVSWRKSRRYEGRLFRQFDLVTMVSEQDRQYCLEALPGYTGPIAVVPNGVDCEHNRPGLADPQPDSLVFNGSLTFSANYDAMRYFLAEVFPAIRAQAPETTLTITGATAGLDLSGLRLDSNVHLTGFVDDVRPYVAGAWACVTPIREGGGTRLKVLEALALGTPVVATSKAVDGHDLTPEAHYLAAGTSEQFVQQTIRLLRDADLRARLAANSRRLVEERYDWTPIGRAFVELCDEAARRLRR